MACRLFRFFPVLTDVKAHIFHKIFGVDKQLNCCKVWRIKVNSNLLSAGFLSCLLQHYTAVQHNFLPQTLRLYHPIVGPRGQIIFCCIATAGSPPMRCRWPKFCPRPSLSDYGCKPLPRFISHLFTIAYLMVSLWAVKRHASHWTHMAPFSCSCPNPILSIVWNDSMPVPSDCKLPSSSNMNRVR